MVDCVSIIVPVYNTKKEYVSECLESLINQTYKNLEILLIDDGSLTETADFLDMYSKKYDNIRVIHKKNEGVSIARNVGLDNALGKWIMFVDADDILPLDSLEKMIVEDSADVILGKICFNWNGSREVGDEQYDIISKETDVKNIKQELIKSVLLMKSKTSSVGAIGAKVYRKKFLEDNNIRFEKYIKLGEDIMFNIRAYLNASNILISKDVVYEYRINSESVTQKYSDKVPIMVDDLVKALDANLKETLQVNYKREYDAFIIYQINYMFIKSIFHKETILKHNEQIACVQKILNDSKYNESINNVELNLLSSRKKALVILLRTRLYFLLRLLYAL